jgi:glycogen phosphorylase
MRWTTSKTKDSGASTNSQTGGAAKMSEVFRAAYARELAQRSDSDSAIACLNAAAVASRTLLADRWALTQAQDAKRDASMQGLAQGQAQSRGQRRVHYLSMEFLMGRALQNALAALKLDSEIAAVRGNDAPALGQVLESEPDAALGNGGLGRLAACFLDSFAELGLPSFGYGLRYEHGMFAQRIQDGRQVEVPDEWLRHGNPWELKRNDVNFPVGFGGVVTSDGGARRWLPAENVVAEAYDFIVPAHQTERVSTLRQWHATAARPIDFAAFCRGDHVASAAHLQAADALNWVLYPDDSTPAGRELRLKQEFLLVSASLQDMLARHLREHHDIETFGRRNAVHLNDTHPALAPAELMRLLLDDHGLDWARAWKVTSEATSYTNHTLMPEALETWPVPMFQALLPRHLEIVYEINRRFLEDVRARFPGNNEIIKRVSLVDEAGERRVRMAALAIVASRKVNGVSALHSQLMVETIFADYAAIWPDKFLNVTNGVTPRRWLMQANPTLSALIDKQIGNVWRRDLTALSGLAPMASNPKLGEEFLTTKRANKVRLADYVRRELGVTVNPDSLFDVQIKRVHEYKRQLLNVLHVVARYQAIVANPNANWTPRTVIFAGKAASAYHAAKSIIQLIHDVGRVINSDPRVGDRLKLVFLPNYSVSLAELIIPAADLSEQISTAGTEASGTGNMKFGLNGALTIGTWDGANIEMAEHMGTENMFVFGLRADDVAKMKSLGYDPRLYAEQNLQLKRVIDAIANGEFSPGDASRYRGLMDNLLNRDTYMLMADFASYVETQLKVDALFVDRAAWAERAVRNVAGMGWFSADRTVQEYVDQVWC